MKWHGWQAFSVGRRGAHTRADKRRARQRGLAVESGRTPSAAAPSACRRLPLLPSLAGYELFSVTAVATAAGSSGASAR
jgi:hypothetical protein